MKGLAISVAMVVVYVVILTVFSQKAQPNNPLHKVLRTQEYITLKTKTSTNERLEYLTFLTKRRMEEVGYVADNELYDYVLPVNSRYRVAANNLVQSSKQLNDQATIIDTKNLLLEHKNTLLGYSQTFPDGAKNARTFSESADYLDIFLAEL